MKLLARVACCTLVLIGVILAPVPNAPDPVAAQERVVKIAGVGASKPARRMSARISGERFRDSNVDIALRCRVLGFLV